MNDEARMTNDEKNDEDQMTNSVFVIRASFVIRHSCFVICH